MVNKYINVKRFSYILTFLSATTFILFLRNLGIYIFNENLDSLNLLLKITALFAFLLSFFLVKENKKRKRINLFIYASFLVLCLSVVLMFFINNNVFIDYSSSLQYCCGDDCGCEVSFYENPSLYNEIYNYIYFSLSILLILFITIIFKLFSVLKISKEKK